MIALLPEAIEAYIRQHTSAEPEILAKLRDETRDTLPMPQMQVGPVEGALLRLMVQISGASRVLEIGTYSGYSAIAMATALPQDGRLVTCDVDPKATAVARRYFDQLPFGHNIEIRLGPASDTLKALAAEGQQFDLVFIDADKQNYVQYWDTVMPMLPVGGLVLADNTLWSGRVIEPQQDSDHAIVAFNRRVREDARVEHVLLPVRDGVMLARKQVL